MRKNTIHILVVEDEPAHAEAVKRAFQQTAGLVHLTLAFSVKEALAELRKSIPELVITDWLLPDGKGTDILSSDNQVFPVVLMTSHGNEQVAVEAMKAGALDYVVKSPAVFADMPHIAERALKQWELLIENRRSQEKLRESEERFRTVFEQGPLGINILGLDYRFVAVNAAFSQVVGYSQDELTKLKFPDVTYPEDLETDVDQAKKLLSGEAPYYKMEKRLVKKQGEIVWIAFTPGRSEELTLSCSYLLTRLMRE